MLRFGCCALLASLLCASPAVARDHYYFSKPGVTRDAYLADAAECAELVAPAQGPKMGPVYVTYPNTTYGAIGAAMGILLAGLLIEDPVKGVQRSVERTCMADKGYARMKVERQLIREIQQLKDEQARLDRLFTLAAAAEPIGTRMGE